MKFTHLALLFLIFAGMPAAALAAQDAVITVDQAALRERPTLDAKIIESKAAGTKIRVSAYNKDGWYKTKASTGQFAWIWQADITVLVYKNDVKAADLEMEEKLHERRSQRGEPWLFFRLGGGLMGIVSTDVSSRLGLGLGHFYWAPGAIGEVAIRLEDRLRLALRLESLSSTSGVQYFGTEYDVTISTVPLLLGLDADISRGESFDISAGFYAGIGLSNRLAVVVPSQGTPNSFSLASSTFALQLDFSAKYIFTRWLSAVFELDFLYTLIPKTPIPAPFNGDTPFRTNATTLSTLHTNITGPIIAAGLQFAL